MSEILTKQILLGSSYIVINKTVLKIFGYETALFLSTLAEAETLLSDADGWFYQTADTIEGLTGLSRYKQDKCVEALEEKEVLIKEVRGLPARRYFRLNYEIIQTLIENHLQSSSKNTSKLPANRFNSSSQATLELGVKKLERNKELINKELINKELNNKDMCDQPLADRDFDLEEAGETEGDQDDQEEKEEKARKAAEKKKAKEKQLTDFELFWQEYPRKVNKSKAREKWLALKLGEKEVAQVMSGLQSYKRIEWVNTEDKYIPHAVTWLNQRRWEDKLQAQRASTSKGMRYGDAIKSDEDYMSTDADELAAAARLFMAKSQKTAD